MRLKKPTMSPADLRPKAAAMLLAGWGAEPPADVRADLLTFGTGALPLWREGPAALWRQNERWLLDVARQWGWTPEVEGPDGICRFYAEHCAVFGLTGRGDSAA